MEKERNKHFLVGIFGDEDDLIHGVEHIRHEGVNIYEVFTPYPVHGLEHALGYNRSRMPVAAFFFGITGTTLAILMQTFMMGLDWPTIIGGKPFLAIPALVPVTFEMTVLLAAFGMSFTFFFTRDLRPNKAPRIFDRRATDDKHVLAIDLADNSKSETEIRELLKHAHADEVYNKTFTDKDNRGAFFPYIADLFTNGVTESSRLMRKR